MARIIGKKEVPQKFNRLREYLESKGKYKYGTPSKIARNLNITTQTVLMWLRNKRQPPLSQLLRLSAYLKCEPQELIIQNNPFTKPI